MTDTPDFKTLARDHRSHFYGHDDIAEITSPFLVNWLESDEGIYVGGLAQFPRADFDALNFRREVEHDAIVDELFHRAYHSSPLDFTARRYIAGLEAHA